MTHATREPENRHDTLPAVTGRSGRGTARQTIRVDETLWERFGQFAAGKGSDRSTVLRDFIRWYVAEPDAQMPERLPPGE